MSDLRARADELAELANDLCVTHGLDAHDAIRAAILRGMVEALEAEPTDRMVMVGDALCPVIGTNGIRAAFRAMAAARAREIKEGK